MNHAAGWSQQLTQSAQQADPPQEDHPPQAAVSSDQAAQKQLESQQDVDPAHLGQDFLDFVPQADTEGGPPTIEHQQDSQVRRAHRDTILDWIGHQPTAACACMRVHARASAALLHVRLTCAIPMTGHRASIAAAAAAGVGVARRSRQSAVLAAATRAHCSGVRALVTRALAVHTSLLQAEVNFACAHTTMLTAFSSLPNRVRSTQQGVLCVRADHAGHHTIPWC